jgi:hypothetical protein
VAELQGKIYGREEVGRTVEHGSRFVKTCPVSSVLNNSIEQEIKGVDLLGRKSICKP